MNKVQIFTTLLILGIVLFGIFICVKFEICEMFSLAGRVRNNNIQYILPQHIRTLNNSSQNSRDLQVPPKYEDAMRNNHLNRVEDSEYISDYDSNNSENQVHSFLRPISSPPRYGSIL